MSQVQNQRNHVWISNKPLVWFIVTRQDMLLVYIKWKVETLIKDQVIFG